MEKKSLNNVRAKTKPVGPRSRQVKILNGFSTFEPLRTDFANIELELENENLRKMIGLVEGKNKVLEEHCSLLKEKNLYYETRLRDMEIERDRKISDKDVDSKEPEKGDEGEEHEKKVTSLKDRISGVIFGVALPKIGSVMSKIREKRHEIKEFIDENRPEGAPKHCPASNVNFKEKFEIVKVNLFRVVIVLGSLMVLSGVGYAGYRIWKTRYRQPGYLVPSDDEDGSTEELFSAPRANQSIPKTNSTDSFEAPGISTDFRSILDTANNK